MDNGIARANTPWLAVIVMLFGLLLLASHGNELLKQSVLTPGSSADLGVPAHCRADELEEEQLSLEECQLMVSNVRIILASSPLWFRSFQMALSSLGIVATLCSLVTAFGLMGGRGSQLRLMIVSVALLLLIDVAGFIAAVNTGPLLRAQYLWPLLLWICIHLCMLLATIRVQGQVEMESR